MVDNRYLRQQDKFIGVYYDRNATASVHRAVPGLILCRTLQQVLNEIGKRPTALALVHLKGKTDPIVDDVPRIRDHLSGTMLVTADEITLSLVRVLAKQGVRTVVPFRIDEIVGAVQRFTVDKDFRDPFDEIVFQSRAMKEVLDEAAAVASGGHPLLITGETGTGKDLVARTVHTARRSGGPFVAENVAGLDDALFSDSLFGHEKGAFTSAAQRRRGKVRMAENGTFFLDEIGDLSPRSQIKLLRLLDRGEFYPLGATQPVRVNVRFVVATNHDLRALVQDGVFRKDLYYRVAYNTIHLPPLDERREDIPVLVDHFVKDAVARLGRPPIIVPQETMELLCSRKYPGNIRQLRSQVFNAVMLCQGSRLSEQYLVDPLSLFQTRLEATLSAPELEARDLMFPNRLPEITEVTTQLVREAMRRSEGNQSKAARMLGITPSAVNKRLQLDDDKVNSMNLVI